jgi:hypothetical protein
MPVTSQSPATHACNTIQFQQMSADMHELAQPRPDKFVKCLLGLA